METVVFKYLLGLAEENWVLALLFFYVRTEVKANKDAREAAEARAREDREANKNDHDRLFAEVSDLKADVKVLRDRSDRSNSDS